MKRYAKNYNSLVTRFWNLDTTSWTGILGVVLLLIAPAAMGQIPEFKPLNDSEFWHFERFLGSGECTVQDSPEGRPVLAFTAPEPDGMAASVRSPLLPIEPKRQYRLSLDIKTEGFEPITARLAGGIYVYFRDAADRYGAFLPRGFIAPRDTDWKTITIDFTTPTTARTAEFHLTYAAYGTWEGGHPRVTGRAHGKLWMRNLRIEPLDLVEPLPATIHVPIPAVQDALDTVAECLHNAQVGGEFTVSDGYTISGNIVPDLSFGLFGVRRLAYPQYVALLQAHWEKVGSTMDDQGRIASQRVMSHLFFPLGIDEIFSFTGDKAWFQKMLPLADRSMSYLAGKADANGLVRLVEYGKWHIGEGADWVDWYPARMEGKTFMFQAWYVRTLQRLAALHEEFAGEFGSADLANEYRQRAEQITGSLRRFYWKENHFVTNIDFGGKVVDENWLDDQVWAIRWGIAEASQVKTVWSWVDEDPYRYEGVPTRWAAFDGPGHGPMSWFGRNGCGDILARYYSGRDRRGYELIQKISEIFARDRNVYEAYDMEGKVVPGTAGWGNYTEHAGGYLWAMVEGPFGIDFESDNEAVANVRPRYPDFWKSAEVELFIRGMKCRIAFQRKPDVTEYTISGEGPRQPIRMILPGQPPKIYQIGDGSEIRLE